MIQVKSNHRDAYQLLHEGTLSLARAEQQGIRFDEEYARGAEQKILEEIKELETTFYKSNFYKYWKHSRGERKPNINSDEQLASYLYKVRKLEPPSRTASGQGSTNEESLQQLEIPELNDLLKIRKLKKIHKTYLMAFIREQVNGYIHPHFNLHLVKTFRSSSDKPNFQNIPKRDKLAKEITRKALFARPGNQLMEVDYSNLEVRIAACYHQDPTMLKYIKDPSTNMHTDMAQQIFMINEWDPVAHKTLRNAAKNGFVFPQFYGDYYKNNAYSLACTWGELPKGKWKPGQGIKLKNGTLSDHLLSKKITITLNGKSYKTSLNCLETFEEHLKDIEFDFWFNRFPVYRQWKEKWWKEYQRTGEVNLFTGFTCSGAMNMKDCINYPIQGAAFHCLLWSLVEIDRWLIKEKLDTRIIGQIHDAIILDVPPGELIPVSKMVREIMVNKLPQAWKWITVPLDVEFDVSDPGESWADMKSFILD